MAELELSPLSPKLRVAFQKKMAGRDRGRDWRSPFDVHAAGYVFTYDFKEELRFGPPYYGLSVAGPRADKFNKLFGDGDYFYSAEPFNPESSLYLFERAADDYRLRREISVYNLASGRRAGSVEDDFLRACCWRPGHDEMILYSWADVVWKKWRVRSRKKERIKNLYDRGQDANFTADGRYMIAHQTGDPLVSLIDLDAETAVHTLTQKDFKKLTPKPQTISLIESDPRTGRLVFLINHQYAHRPRPKLTYDLAVAVEISNQ